MSCLPGTVTRKGTNPVRCNHGLIQTAVVLFNMTAGSLFVPSNVHVMGSIGKGSQKLMNTPVPPNM